MTTTVAITGVSGRMGRALLSAALADSLDVVGGTVRPGHSMTGKPLSTLMEEGVVDAVIVDNLAGLPVRPEVVVDFTNPEATLAHAEFCAAAGIGMVIGTTGFTDLQYDKLVGFSEAIPLCVAANFSTGVNVLLEVLAKTTALLGDSVDIEIIEAHHRNKVDAPSGTALAMGQVVADSLGRDLSQVAEYGRHGITGARSKGTIGFSAIRAGDVVGDHTVIYASDGERIEITHRASSRMAFASGATRAAGWLAGKSPGLYDMRDVLGLTEIGS